MTKNNNPIIIVGAGLAGLTAANYLVRENRPVLLIEKNETVGGLINSFYHEGFLFDTGARSIENAGIIKPMLKDLQIDLPLLKSKVSLGIENNIFDIQNNQDLDKYEKVLQNLFPENKKEIKKIFNKIYKVIKKMEIIYGFDNPVFKKDFTKDKEYLLKEMLPWFKKFISAVLYMNRTNEPIEDFLQKYTSNQSLIDTICQHFFKNTPTFFALGYFYVYLNYLYPKEGTFQLPNKLSENFLKNNGKIKFNTKIEEIVPYYNKIVDSENNEYYYSDLFWAADLKKFYSNLNLYNLEKTTAIKLIKEKKEVMKTRGGDSVFSLYIGIDKPKEYFSKITKEHLFYTPFKSGLREINKSELANLLKNFDNLDKKQILEWVYRYCYYNTYEISIPALRNSKLAPENKTGMIISLLFEYDLVKKIYNSGWYNEFKTKVEEYIIEILGKTIFPELEKNILFKISSTPLSIENKVETSEGGITGWTYTKEVPVIHDLKKIPKSVITPIDNIYKIGQWVYSPAGIPTAILTGWYATDNLLKKSRID